MLSVETSAFNRRDGFIDFLTVQIVVALVVDERLAARGATGAGLSVGESEVAAESSLLLQGLAEHLVLLDVLVGDGAAGKLHGLLKVALGHLRQLILFIIHIHVASLEIVKNHGQ